LDLADVYRATQQRLTTLAPQLTPGQLATVTEACPDWTVRDVLGHLVGLAGDIAAGRFEGAGRPERTAVQVAGNADSSIDELIERWNGHLPAVEQTITQGGPRLRPPIVDIWTHEQDLVNPIGIESGRGTDGQHIALEAAWTMKRKLRAAELPSVRIITEDVDWTIGDTDPAATTVRASSYEVARAVIGRRSLDQIRGYDWHGNPEPYLPYFTVFSPPGHPIME
jgi:uncharacterized protein (TIGR03083 family)